MTYCFNPAPQPAVAISGTNTFFPVRRIYCVGQNYLAHVLEMGSDPTKPPFFFDKPNNAVVPDGGEIPYALSTQDLHYEAELVVAIGKPGVQISSDRALDHVCGYATGIDLTRRDLQTTAKNAGKPWDMSKGFDNSAPCGAIHPVSEVGHIAKGRIALSVNGELRQDSDLSDMIWSVPDIIATLSQFQALAPGDLIYTGTPSGVGPVVAGDKLTVEIADLSDLSVSIT